MSERKIALRFWGTRGSVPSPGRDKIKYGGNTSCVALSFPGRPLIILDGGTGIRQLGNHLMTQRKKIAATILLSHYHWDHIQGLPFFAPAYHPRHRITVCGAHHAPFPLERIFSSQMESIHFPVKSSALLAELSFRHLTPGETSIDDIDLQILRSNHPSTTFSYRLSCNNHAIVYMTDNEILPGTGRERSHIAYDRGAFIRFIAGADILIHDAQYTDREYRTKKGWGHSPWKEAVKLAAEAGVKHLSLFHHDPDHSDATIDALGQECRKIIQHMAVRLQCSVAQEGKTLYL